MSPRLIISPSSLFDLAKLVPNRSRERTERAVIGIAHLLLKVIRFVDERLE